MDNFPLSQDDKTKNVFESNKDKPGKIKDWFEQVAFAGKNIPLLFLRRPIDHQ